MAQPSMSSMFKEQSADVVIRSSDGLEFWLHKVILSLASPIFKDMFSLPRSQDANRETVEVTEIAKTMEDLLRFCYPMRDPELLPLNRLSNVLGAAKKYEIEFIVTGLKTRLRSFVSSDAMRVYCIAYKYEDAELAQAAAEHLMTHNLSLYDFNSNPPPEFSQLPITALAKLIAYRERCIVVATAALMDDEWMIAGFSKHDRLRLSIKRKVIAGPTTWVWLSCSSCSEGTVDISVRFPGHSKRYSIRPRQWWQNYRDAVVRELSLFPGPLSSVPSHQPLIRSAVAGAQRCFSCGHKAAAELSEYAEGVGNRIRESLMKVKIDFPFKAADQV